MVYVDNQPIGTTPCAIDFTYYGVREIRLVKAGYETLTVNQPLPAPWYEIAPLDFVSENLIPSKIQDYRTASFNLSPQVIVPTEQLIANGEQLRQSTRQGAVTPPSEPAAPNLVLPLGITPNQPTFPAPAQPATSSWPTPTLPQGNQALPSSPISPGVIVAPPPGSSRLPVGGQSLGPAAGSF